MGQYMAHLETQASFAKAEIDRLRQRKAVYERAFERVEQLKFHSVEFTLQTTDGLPMAGDLLTVVPGLRASRS
jgi:hypothetical protein